MKVVIRDCASGHEWLLTNNGDPSKCDEYVDLVRKWGVHIWPEGHVYAGTIGAFSGSFHVTEGQDVVVFTVDVEDDDA